MKDVHFGSNACFQACCPFAGNAIGVERRLKVVFRRIRMMTTSLKYVGIWNGRLTTVNAALCVLNKPKSMKNVCSKR